MATKAEAKARALQLLGVKMIGQDADAQDNKRMEDAYDEVYSQLKKSKVAIWAQTGTIPDDIMPWLAGLMALNANIDYGVSNQRYSRLITDFGQDGVLAMRNIKELSAVDYEDLSEPEDF